MYQTNRGRNLDIEEFIELSGLKVEHFRDKIDRLQEAKRVVEESISSYENSKEAVEHHMKYCQDCMTRIIGSGILIDIEDWRSGKRSIRGSMFN